MSEALEKLLAENTAALQELTTVQKQIVAAQQDLIAAAKSKIEEAAAGKGTRTKKKDDEPVAETKAEPETKAETKVTYPTIDDVKTVVLSYGVKMPDDLAKIIKDNKGVLPDGKWTGEQKFLVAERKARLDRLKTIFNKSCGFADGKAPAGENDKSYTDVPEAMREKVIASIKAAVANGNLLKPEDFKDDADEAATTGGDDDLF